MTPEESLEMLGLNEKQALCYLALLQLGRGSAFSIADKSGLKRPTTYVILGELIEKGLVDRVPRVRKQLYVPLSPERAFATIEEKFTRAKQKLPELLAMTKGTDTKVSAVFFEGIKGIKQLAEYRIKEFQGQEVVGFWATDQNVSPELVRYFKEEFQQVFKRHDIKMRGIVPDYTNLKFYRETDSQFGRSMKVVPESEFSSEVAIESIGDVVRISDYKNLQGIAIENKDVAKTVREIFEMLWRRVDDPEPSQ